MNLADTFVNLNPGSPSHLWVVITRPTTQGEIAIVNFTTKRQSSDDSCVVSVDEHPFVQTETVVAYRFGQIVKDRVLDSGRQHGYLRTHQPVSSELLRRIQQGALASPYTMQAIQDAVRATVGRS